MSENMKNKKELEKLGYKLHCDDSYLKSIKKENKIIGVEKFVKSWIKDFNGNILYVRKKSEIF